MKDLHKDYKPDTIDKFILVYSLELAQSNKPYFMQLAFNLSNGVTDILESSTILTYSKSHMSLYTQMVGKMPC
jgi:hypothetical protein